MTNKDETNSLCGRKTIPPKSHKKVNHGDRVNATELQKRTFSIIERVIRPNKRRTHPIIVAVDGVIISL